MRITLTLWCGTALYLVGSAGVEAAPPAKPATRSSVAWAKIASTANAYFAALPDHQAGDIISRKQVENLLPKLTAIGWNVPDQQKLLSKVLADNSWLVTNLRTPKGKKFARQIATFPQGYDRTDRLTAIPDGRGIVSALIQGPGGQQMIEFLTTSRTGKNTSRELTAVPGGADFDKPTGKIYTANALLTELQRLHGSP